jgi:hypothetical protein
MCNSVPGMNELKSCAGQSFSLPEGNTFQT